MQHHQPSRVVDPKVRRHPFDREVDYETEIRNSVPVSGSGARPPRLSTPHGSKFFQESRQPPSMQVNQMPFSQLASSKRPVTVSERSREIMSQQRVLSNAIKDHLKDLSLWIPNINFQSSFLSDAQQLRHTSN